MPGLKRFVAYTFYLACAFAVISFAILALVDWFNPYYEANRLAVAGEYQQGIDVLNKALADKNWVAVRDPRVFHERGWCKMKLKDYRGAIADLNTAMQMNDSTNIHYLWTTPRRRQRRFLSTRILSDRGYTFYLAGDLDSALKDYNRALDSEKDATEILYRRALVFRKKKDYKTAVKELDRIIALDDNNENAFHERGSIAALEDRNEDALKDLSRAIEINDCGGAHYDRALVYKDKKQMPEALQDLNAAIQSDPKDEQAFHVRGRVQLSLKNYQAAVSDFDRAAQLDPTCTSVGRDRAKAEQLLKSAK